MGGGGWKVVGDRWRWVEVGEWFSISPFKHKLKKWKSEDCLCRLCKAWNVQMVFLEVLLLLVSVVLLLISTRIFLYLYEL